MGNVRKDYLQLLEVFFDKFMCNDKYNLSDISKNNTYIVITSTKIA
jgi:hypothetical protein